MDESKMEILVLGTADWDQPIATNQHYMVRELAEASSVTFVESMGLRRPQLSRRDMNRVIKRLKKADRSAITSRDRPPNLDVVSPVLAPVHTGFLGLLNKHFLRKLVVNWRNSSAIKVLWTYTPVTYGLERVADIVVYHCVDLLGEVPGISRALIDFNEKALSHEVDAAIGSSLVVAEHLAAQGFDTVLRWENVADVEAIAAARPTTDRRISNRVVFAGNLSPTKVDFDVLSDIAKAGFDLQLAGPIAEGGGDAGDQVRALEALGATYNGHLSLTDLAALYWSSAVGVIPYQINSYTRGVNPLKTFEYLAAGLGVVSTPVPAVQAADFLVDVSDASEFVNAVRLMAEAISGPVISRRIEKARGNSWGGRGQQARKLLEELANGARK